MVTSRVRATSPTQQLRGRDQSEEHPRSHRVGHQQEQTSTWVGHGCHGDVSGGPAEIAEMKKLLSARVHTSGPAASRLRGAASDRGRLSAVYVGRAPRPSGGPGRSGRC